MEHTLHDIDIDIPATVESEKEMATEHLEDVVFRAKK